MIDWQWFILSCWILLLITGSMLRPRKEIERIIEQPKLPPIDIRILQAHSIQPTDVLLFRVKSDVNLSAAEMLSMKTATEQFLTAHGIANEVLYLNNVEFEIARTRIT